MREKVLAEVGVDEGNCKFWNPGTIHEQGQLVVETIPTYWEGDYGRESKYRVERIVA